MYIVGSQDRFRRWSDCSNCCCLGTTTRGEAVVVVGPEVVAVVAETSICTDHAVPGVAVVVGTWSNADYGVCAFVDW